MNEVNEEELNLEMEEDKKMMDEINELHLDLQKKIADLKAVLDEKIEHHFFDVQIDCGSTIFPAHKYVLSSRSKILADQLSVMSGKVLNWTNYGHDVSVALLRWFYTNQIVLDNHSITLDLLRASHHLQLKSIFEFCELTLSSSVEEKSIQFCEAANEVGSHALRDKILEFKAMMLHGNSSVEMEIVKIFDTDEPGCVCVKSRMNDQVKQLYTNLETLIKRVSGFEECLKFADVKILTVDDSRVWLVAHKFVLSSRSEEMLKTTQLDNDTICFDRHENVQGDILRWIYTDIVDDAGITLDLLLASHDYQLPTLFKRCEQALCKTTTVISCAHIHVTAAAVGASTLMKHCEQLISSYWHSFQSQLHMEMDIDADDGETLDEITGTWNLLPATGGLLVLNDDCLLHIFRFVALVDLSSLKATCKRFARLADQSFRLYREKALSIHNSSMFADIWNLKHFGKLINSLHLNSFYKMYASHELIFEMIARFTGKELKSISLNIRLDDKVAFTHLAKVLKNIEIIELEWLSDQYIESILNYCENLKEVSIEGGDMQMETLRCSKNKSIRSITLTGLATDDILKEISDELPNLECLHFTQIEDKHNELMHLSRLRHLKRLTIEADSINIGNVLQQFVEKNALQYLCLLYAEITETLAHVLSNFPNLKELVFDGCYGFGENEVECLSKTLVNVQSLSFIMCEEVTIDRITKVIENHLSLKKLSISSCEEVDFIDRKNYLRLCKKRDLEIVLEDEVYVRSMEMIGDYLSKGVRITREQR